MAIVKFVGKETAKQILKEFTGPGIDQIKTLLLGEEEDVVQQYLEKLDRQMRDVVLSLKDIELRQIFLDYNRADEELEHLFDLYHGQIDKPVNHRDRQNTCSYILDINKGVSERARRMISAFRHVNLPAYKTFFQEYSDKLAGEYHDVHTYLDKMGAVMNHLRMNLIEAKVLREACYSEIADKERATDLALTYADVRRVERHYEKVVGPAVELKNQLQGLAEAGEPVRLKHLATGKYLTTFEGGDPLSRHAPFGDERMPQVYLYGMAKGQVETYREATPVQVHDDVKVIFIKKEVTVESKSQEWRVVKVEGDDKRVRFAFQLRGGGKALDGVRDGRVYINPLPADRKNEHMWWEPVMSRGKDGKFEPGVFILRHKPTGLALDGDGARVYAENGRKPDYDNAHMKWRFDQKNAMEPGESLAPGEELVSHNQRYALRYLANGNLELFDRDRKRVLWETHTANRGAWRCVMQKDDGLFAVYAKEKEAVWSTNRRGSLFAGSRLVLRDGFFEVIDREGDPVYDTRWLLRREQENALGPDEFLAPGERLVSQNRRYELRYLHNGNLELYDGVDNKVCWHSGTAGTGAWRCVMQRRNGQFVVYAKEQAPVWATKPDNSKFADSTLTLLDDGTLRLGTPENNIYWKKDVKGDESWKS
ncbi:MAG TPA: hypothetical protein VD968_15970 [Pyrinomonadaceae bacterium]|nr:hypothetical protein [Pyrinomonadaceae bacterium]